MATSRYPTTQAIAGGFVISAGCILFRIRDEDKDNYTPPSPPLSGSRSVNAHVNAVDDQRSSSANANDHEGAGADTRSEPADSDVVAIEDQPSVAIDSESNVTLNDQNKLEVCILHHLKGNEWLLPKGRKDRGESIEAAAIRETYEETGYPCQLWALRMPTRAPPPGALGDTPSSHRVQVVEGLTEPVAVTTRTLGRGLGIKLIFWYVARVEGEGVKEENTQMPNESFESVFVSPENALGMLTFENDREVVRCAVGIVRDNLRVDLERGGDEGVEKKETVPLTTSLNL